ncbi:hypothetical protein [Kutzneria sp. CA-103260]|uniref:hypothetical protein n=1 Tax=Kutzneria sp. CA-103260 TaxID=2802641 RepID=UPI001BF05FBA|nr:hypothetical protein [Kutzneria sp. CA-103260]QUQ71820.1 hypothetical protein JJ691_96070 [Kutzneria sp. CA-103260]
MTEMSEERKAAFRLEVLATVVRAELVAAGLPVMPEDDPPGTAGALVRVDRPDMRGVLVDWQSHSVLMDAALEAWAEDPLQEGEETAAFKRLNDGIGEAMQEAMRKIMTTAGLEVVDTDNDYAPHELLVTRLLTKSPWQQRRSAAHERRGDRMRAAWNQRHEDERRKQQDSDGQA